MRSVRGFGFYASCRNSDFALVASALLLLLGAGVCAQAFAQAPKRLVPADVGLVVNQADPYSVAVGDYYARQRGLDASQVVYVDLPVKPVLSAAEFEPLQAQLKTAFGGKARALVLAWAVLGQSIALMQLVGALVVVATVMWLGLRKH